jgi:predicted secreted protein
MINANEMSALPEGAPDTLDLLMAKYFRRCQEVATLAGVRGQLIETGNKAMQERDKAQAEANELRAKLAGVEAKLAVLEARLAEAA